MKDCYGCLNTIQRNHKGELLKGTFCITLDQAEKQINELMEREKGSSAFELFELQEKHDNMMKEWRGNHQAMKEERNSLKQTIAEKDEINHNKLLDSAEKEYLLNKKIDELQQQLKEKDEEIEEFKNTNLMLNINLTAKGELIAIRDERIKELEGNIKFDNGKGSLVCPKCSTTVYSELLAEFNRYKICTEANEKLFQKDIDEFKQKADCYDDVNDMVIKLDIENTELKLKIDMLTAENLDMRNKLKKGKEDKARKLIVSADSYLSLIRHRHNKTPIPDDVVYEIDKLIGELRKW
jgi:hypothetical protein